MNPLTVCFVTEDFYPSAIGGQGVYGQHLVAALAKMGHHITVFAENRPQRDIFWKNTKNVVLHLTPYCHGNQLFLAVSEYLSFLKNCRGEAVDVVHANQLSGLLFCLFRPPNVKKVTVTVHNTYADLSRLRVSPVKSILYNFLKRVEREMYGKAGALVFHTAYERQQFFRTFGHMDNKSYNAQIGVSDNKFTHSEKILARQQICRKYSIEKTKKIILYVGRLVKRKNVDLLIDAGRSVTNAVVIIVGDGTERAKIQSYSDIYDNVRVAGSVDDVRLFYLAADCFAMLSEAEGGVSLSVLEAASFRLPLVVSASAQSIPVRQGVNGYIVDPYKTGEVRDALKKAVSRPVLGRRAHDAVRRYTWERCARETLIAYR